MTVRRRGGPVRPLFDAATEEPDLLEADRRARKARRERRAPAPSPAIDPRIAARRAEVEAETAAGASRHRRRLASAVIALVVLVGAGGLVLLSPLAGVRTIVVLGAGRTDPADVRAATGLQPGSPLVRVDEGAVAARVAALPWVRRARLQRRWPSTVVVRIDERRPAAVAPCQASGEACLIDAEGRLLAAASDDPVGAAALPGLVGVPGGGNLGETLPAAVLASLAVAVALPDGLRPLVLAIRTEGSEVSLDLRAPGRRDSPPVVRLGPGDRIPDKLTAAATVLARTSVNGVAVLDVRVPESPAVTRLAR